LKITELTGKVYRFYCPSNCQDKEGAVFGTEFYSEQSSICRSAIHDGIIDNQGGEFLLIIAIGK